MINIMMGFKGYENLSLKWAFYVGATITLMDEIAIYSKQTQCQINWGFSAGGIHFS